MCEPSASNMLKPDKTSERASRPRYRCALLSFAHKLGKRFFLRFALVISDLCCLFDIVQPWLKDPDPLGRGKYAGEEVYPGGG